MAEVENGLLNAMELLVEIKNEVKEIKQTDSGSLKDNIKALEAYTQECKKEIGSLLEGVANKKSIRLLHNLHLYRSLAYQEISINANGEIVKYGDIFFNGHTTDNKISGCGRGVNTSAFSRVALPHDIEFIEVFGGHTTFYALPKTGNFIYVWGMNASGCAGVGHTDQIPFPIKVEFESRVVKIVCGKSINNSYQSALALCENGKVYVAGRNATGQLGTNNTLDINKWSENANLSNIKDIYMASIGNEALSLCIDNEGALYTFGHNAQGACGNGKTENVLLPFKQTFREKVKLAKASINNASGINSTSLILLESGQIYGAGYNGQKQLSLQHTNNVNTFTKLDVLNGENNGFIDIAPASLNATAFALKSDGRAYAFGYGGYGFGDKNAENNQNARPIQENVKSMSVANDTAYTRAIFMLNDMSLCAFGYNTDGALGVGDNTDTKEIKIAPSPQIKDLKLQYFNNEAILCAIVESMGAISFYASGNALDNNLIYNTPMLQKQF